MKFPQVKFMFNSLTTRVLVMILCVGVTAISISAQRRVTKSEEQTTVKVEGPISNYNGGLPIAIFPGANTNCGDLNAMKGTLTQFSNLSDGSELRIGNAAGVPNGVYEFTTGGVRTLTGTPRPGDFISVSSANSTARLLGFSSQVPILAVIIKAGPDSYAYSYQGTAGGVYSDLTTTNTNDTRGISHINFCFGVTIGPSAANSTVSGRVTDSYGRGISGARISVNDASTGAVTTVATNPFGYYTVTNLESADFYIMTVSHKRYTFANSSRSFTLNQDLLGADFVANP